MPLYTLIERKLRQYIFLGHEYSMYVPPPIRNSFWDQNDHNHADVTGVRIIAKIVNKNNTGDINAIVPLILKIQNDDNLYDDHNLIFLLAVCAKFSKPQCLKMVTDAYAAVSFICTDGLKLLMFVKFCQDVNHILHKMGYVSSISTGFGNGLRKTIKKWYFQKDPLKLTELILKHKCFEGLTHKDLMKRSNIHSYYDPGHHIIIIYTLHGIKKFKEIFELKLKEIHDDRRIEKLKTIYNYIENIHNIPKMDEIKLRNEIECKKWGLQHQIIPVNKLNSTEILTSLIKHMPLSILLDNTYFFAKLRLFHNSTPRTGVREYISRFNNTNLLIESKIHPIESFVEYVEYSRRSRHIVAVQNSILKKKGMCNIDAPDKFKVFLKTNKKNTRVNQTTEEFAMEVVNQEEQLENNDVQNQSIGIVMLKPLPILENELLTFLSKDLIRKTLQNLFPSNRRILVSYDGRTYMKTKKCLYTNLLSVHEAITLIILSLIYPETLRNKPTICALKQQKSHLNIKINYQASLTFSNLESVLYEPNMNNLNEDDTLDNLFSINWARQNRKMYDVFVLLGTNEMNLRHIKKAVKGYQTFSQNSVKVIVCCLNGKHIEQGNLIGNNYLFISGFDKYIGKVIDGFIKEDF